MKFTIVRMPYGLLQAAIELAGTHRPPGPVSLTVATTSTDDLRELQVSALAGTAAPGDSAAQNTLALHLTANPTLTACHELRRWHAGNDGAVLFLAVSASGYPTAGVGFVRAAEGVDGIRTMCVDGPGSSCIDLSDRSRFTGTKHAAAGFVARAAPVVRGLHRFPLRGRIARPDSAQPHRP